MSTESARTAADPRSDDLPGGALSNGWISFAAIVLFINGFFTFFWGLAAVLNDNVVAVGGGEGVLIADFTTWGWVMMVLGVVMFVTAIGLFTGNTGARLVAIVLVTLNALAQFAIVTAFPLWGILVIVLDVVILYQLIVRWDENPAY